MRQYWQKRKSITALTDKFDIAKHFVLGNKTLLPLISCKRAISLKGWTQKTTQFQTMNEASISLL